MMTQPTFHLHARLCLVPIAALAILAAGPAGAASRTWVGPVNGDWFAANNWSPNDNCPQDGDTVAITSGSAILTNATALLGSFTITNAALIFTNWNTALQATNVTVRNNGKLFHLANTDTNGADGWSRDNRIYVICTNLTVELGGQINADTNGFGGAPGTAVLFGYGPGGGGSLNSGAAGGSYGGVGGIRSGYTPTQAAVYGLTNAPDWPGSGGGAGNAATAPGGAGGGLVTIQASGTATVYGTISAKGKSPTTGTAEGPGSGGGIFLTCGTLNGTGTLNADGGNATSWGGPGGGGRIAVICPTLSNWFGTISANRGALDPNSGGYANALGTVYLPGGTWPTITGQAWNGRVFNAAAVNWSSLDLAGGTLEFNEPGLQLTVQSNMNLRGGAMLTLVANGTNGPLLQVGGDLVMTNIASLTVNSCPTNGGATPYYGALVGVTGTVMLASNSWIYPCSNPTNGGSPTFRVGNLNIAALSAGFNADARGYSGGTSNGYGPGRGKTTGPTSTMSSGGSYGGLGGTGYWNTAQGTPTTTYGSTNAPCDPGSGAGWYNTGVGCSGGGLVRIEAQGDVTLNGKITACGGTSPAGDYKGGGSGGGIYITCRTLKGTQGFLSATGGSSGVYSPIILSGAGGGGRIAVWSALSLATTGTWTITASGGPSTNPPSVGSRGTVVIDRSPTPPMITNTAATGITFDSATLNATLITTGTAPSYVSVYWGPIDQTTNKDLWANTNIFAGAQSEGANLSTNLTGLPSGATYWYRYYATNALGETWASPAQSFTTIAGVPVISNATSGATAVTLTSATLNGNLVSVGTAATSLKVFWGPADGGTNWGAWANTNSFSGTQSAGIWSTNVSLSASNVFYFYTFYATNAGGEVWASPSVPFIAANVTLVATDPNAIEKGANNTGTFTVYRPASVTNLPLTVNYTASGTASNGVDYALLPGSTIIPAGTTSNDITIAPIFDGVYDIPDKQVTLTLAPGGYVVGTPSSGTVTIQDVAPAATNTWTGIGDWTNAANWSDAHTPFAGQKVVVQGTVTVSSATAPLGATVIATNSILTFSGTNAVLTATDITISGTVTHVANSAVATNQFGQWIQDGRVCIVCTNLTVAAGGQINADSRGYAGGLNAGCGPGAGSKGTAALSGGGSYGGVGGLAFRPDSGGYQGSVTNTYGSATAPSDPGSGAGGYGATNGAAGGGLIRIDAKGTVTLNGKITANGGRGRTSALDGDPSPTAAGSGGGIYITCGRLAGSNGVLSAVGGTRGDYGSPAWIFSGAGGGGRIAVWSIFSQTATGTWTISASGGAAESNLCAGATGTVVFARTPSVPVITNAAATSVTFDSATLNGTLISTGTSPTYVSVYWGPADKVTDKNAWANTNVFPDAQAEGANLTTDITGLDSGITYWYRYYATNSLGETWASPAQSFTTVAGLPVISNATSGATAVTLTSATLNGNLVSIGTSATSLKVFWGPTDGGTTWGAWANTNSFDGYQGAGAWSTNVTLAASNTYYYYTFYATNNGGEVWASPSVPFIAAGVTVTATDPNAIEKGANNTGMFTVERPAALTNLPLTVNYTASGTASNGVDYVLIPNSIVIPAGATTNTITIVPIMDGVYDVPDKQVTLTLAPGAYAIGTPSSDTVTIQDVAPSTANTWTGTGNWTNAANWSDAIPPLPGQRVVIQGTTTLATASVALGPVTIVSNFTLIFSGTNSVLTATDVTISGTVTHVANSTVTTNQFGQWVADARVCIVCTNLTIAASGKIDVIGKGYGGGGSRTNGFGPSGGLFVTYGMGAGGGGYGGRGGFLANRGTQAVAYGSAALPTQPGSGGGGDSGYSGGGGGGLVWLAVAANATVNGAIIVDGAKGGQICGSGSGGSLYLSAQTLLGNGSITAKGGDGDAQYGSGGGGGRLALYAGDASAWAGRIDVSPGWTHTLAPLTPAQVGTVYALNTSLLRESFTNQQWRLYGVVAWAPGQLTVSSNAYLSFEDTALTLTVGSNMTVTGASYLGLGAGMLSNAGPFSVGGNLVVQGASTLAIGATNALTNAVAFSVAGNLTVQGASALSIGVANTLPQTAALAVAGDMMLSNGASLTVYSGPTNGATPYGYGALVSVVGNILLASNSWIYPYSHGTNGGSPIFRMRDLTILTNAGFNANGAGFAGGLSTGFGPGFGSKGADLLSGGASHGGPGGRGYWSAYLGTVGPTNGSMQTPTSPGSGAGGYSTVPGGAGGGLVRIEAAHLLTINGTITANGQNGTATPTAGGAGGAIYIRCGTLAGDSAILSANGGSYGDYGSSILAGAGGGGRIAVWRVGTTANTNTWSVTANGGAGKTGFDPVAGAAGSVFWGALPPPGTVFLMQ